MTRRAFAPGDRVADAVEAALLVQQERHRRDAVVVQRDLCLHRLTAGIALPVPVLLGFGARLQRRAHLHQREV